jgi:hypothetical protein
MESTCNSNERPIPLVRLEDLTIPPEPTWHPAGRRAQWQSRLVSWPSRSGASAALTAASTVAGLLEGDRRLWMYGKGEEA